MENFPASDFMSDFEIIEIDNEIYENNRRRLVIEAEEQRLAREAELLELQRQEGERFLIQAAREAEEFDEYSRCGRSSEGREGRKRAQSARTTAAIVKKTFGRIKIPPPPPQEEEEEEDK